MKIRAKTLNVHMYLVFWGTDVGGGEGGHDYSVSLLISGLALVGPNYLLAEYHNDPKFSDRYAWANSADSDQTTPRGQSDQGLEEQSDQGLHCLPFHLHRLDSLLCGTAK